MYVNSDTDTERNLAVEHIIEDIPGGGTVEPDDFKSDTEEMEEGALLGVDSNGIYRLFKTAKIITGGSASAPRINLAHELKVGDVISDGIVALEIDTITEGETYDTLGFDSGDLTISAADTILYVVETVDTTGSGKVADATVEDTSGDTLKCEIPVEDSPADFNGVTLKIEQAADDNLAVVYDAGVLTITLADTTAANNNVAEIQAAVRALGTVEGIDWSGAEFTGTDWDDKQTGATLTDAEDNFSGGINPTRKTPYYSPVAIAMNSVDLSSDVANKGCGLLKKGRVRESLLPFYVDSNIKALLPDITFA